LDKWKSVVYLIKMHPFIRISNPANVHRIANIHSQEKIFSFKLKLIARLNTCYTHSLTSILLIYTQI